MAELVRAAHSRFVIPLVIAALGALGCSASDSPAERPEVAGVATADAIEEPATVVPTQSMERVPEATELEGAWLLEDLAGRGVMDIAQTTLVFDGAGRVSGSGGCNRFTGSFTFTDGGLVFGPLAGTKMMCPEAVMDQEDRFHEALAAVDRVAVDGPFLLIYSTSSEMPLRFTRMETDTAE